MAKYSFEFKKKVVLSYLNGEGGRIGRQQPDISIQVAGECAVSFIIQ